MDVYLDHAATTPADPAVVTAMQPWLTGGANPSSAHRHGRRARRAVEAAREQVASALGCMPLEVVFTSGGTEADNQAIKGLAWAGRAAGRGGHIVTTAIEHHAVLDACTWMHEAEGFELTVVAPNADGVVPADRILGAVRNDTVLIALMAANNELGTLQPVTDVLAGLDGREVPLHVDAVQALGKTPLDLRGVASAAISAHKLGGPTGVGVLLLRRDAETAPLLHGGGQERGVRSGTLHVAGIVGCGEAIERAVAGQPAAMRRLERLRDRLRDKVLAVPDVTENGDPRRRTPHHLSVGVAGTDADALLTALDVAGVSVSLGSACQSGATTRSHVLNAIGAPPDRAHVRFSLGHTTTDEDVNNAAVAFAEVVTRLRASGGGFL